MKFSFLRSLTFALALSAGAATAQNTGNDGTFAGTDIQNVASGSYFDPSTNSTATLNSNTVITTVQAKPGFDIVYFNGGNDGLGGTSNVGNTYDSAPSSARDTIPAGGSYPTPYIVVNNGNTTQSITLTTTSTGANTPTVAYYLDTNKDGILQDSEKAAGSTNTITLPYDDPTTTTVDEGLAYFIQVITLPTNATPGSLYTASPVGTGKGFDATTNQPVDMQESTTVLGLQFATVTVANQPPVANPTPPPRPSIRPRPSA